MLWNYGVRLKEPPIPSWYNTSILPDSAVRVLDRFKLPCPSYPIKQMQFILNTLKSDDKLMVNDVDIADVLTGLPLYHATEDLYKVARAKKQNLFRITSGNAPFYIYIII